MAEITEKAYVWTENGLRLKLAEQLVRDCLYLTETNCLAQRDLVLAIANLRYATPVEIIVETPADPKEG